MDRPEPVENRPFLPEGPAVGLPRKNPLASFLFYAAVVAVGGIGAFGCLITAFDLPVNVPSLALWGGILLPLCVVQWLLPKRRWLAALGSLGVWGLLVWRLFTPLSFGAVRVVNAVLAAYGERLNFELPTLPLPAGIWVDRRYSVTLLLVFALFLYLWLTAGSLIRRGGALGAFCLSGLILLIPLAFSIVPAAWAMGTLLLFWAFLLLAAPSLRRRRSKRDKGRVRVSGEVFARPAALLLLPLLALLLWGTYRRYPVETYVRPEAADQIREGLTQAANMPALLRGGTGSGGNTVDLHSLGGRAYTGETVLRTKHEWQGPSFMRLESPTRLKDYLKSFVGSVYTGGSWERLSPEDTARLAEIFPEGHAQTLPADLSQAVYSPADVHSAYLVTVRKIDVDPRSVYTPYGLYGSEEIFQGMEFEADGYVRSDSWFSGPQEYTVPGVAMPETGNWMFNRFYYGYANAGPDFLAQTILSFRQEHPDQADQWEPIPTARNLYDDLMERLAEDSSASAIDLWTIPEDAMDAFVQHATYEGEQAVPEEGGEMDIQSYRVSRNLPRMEIMRRAEAYTRFVYDHYTQLPDSTRQFARGYLSSHGLSPDLEATDRELVIRRVREMLARECTYTLSPRALPPGRDMAEFFLDESHEGFCVHFATAAVALLRAAGIPCRYAEGYAVPVDKEGGWVDVPDYNAHAWVEVYWGGTGWVPFEMTPAGPDAPAAYANATAPSTQEELAPTPEPSATPEPTATPAPSASPTPSAGPTAGASPTPEPSAQARREAEGRSAFFGFLLALALLAAPFVLLIVLRRIRLAVRRALFRQKDRNKAALRVYAHLLRLYRENAALPYGGLEPPEEMEELALKARFSQHTLTEEELGRMLALADQLEGRLNEQLSPWQRRRCKYLLALF